MQVVIFAGCGVVGGWDAARLQPSRGYVICAIPLIDILTDLKER